MQKTLDMLFLHHRMSRNTAHKGNEPSTKTNRSQMAQYPGYMLDAAELRFLPTPESMLPCTQKRNHTRLLTKAGYRA